MKYSTSSSTTLLAALAAAGYASAAGSCPSSSPISCQNTTAIRNTCCTEVHGEVVQVQFWDADPATGPADSWTIHGLWPDNCDGGYPQNCDASRAYTNISCILAAGGEKGQTALSFMQTYWKDENGGDESFWEHEWAKHGTCYSTLQPSCYADYTPFEEVIDFFSQTTTLFQSLPTYKWLADAGITPSSSQKYSTSDVLAALQQPRGVSASISCQSGKLSQIEYAFNVQGSVDGGKYIPVDVSGSSSNCGSSLSYPPKNLDTSPSVSTPYCPDAPTQTATDEAPTQTAAEPTQTTDDGNTQTTDEPTQTTDAAPTETTGDAPAQTTDDGFDDGDDQNDFGRRW
ncbi:hypothetical protein ANO11243_044590 [Dothideomycetidae sp. 11243]|nr:hypothetical protein ANO11243_044590 [fungal sp. No.11243]